MDIYKNNKRMYLELVNHFKNVDRIGMYGGYECNRFTRIYDNRIEKPKPYQRVLQLLKNNRLQNYFVKLMEESNNSDRNYSDEFIFNKLRKFYRNKIKKSTHIEKSKKQDDDNNNKRPMSRTKDIMKLLGENTKITKYLDVGCGNGTITENIGKTLGLSKEDVHGCDIFDVSDKNKEITYKKLEDEKSLPYKDAEFDLITVFMAMHHFRNLAKMLSEIKRVLKPGGHFIFREHDCDSDDLSDVIDIQHGLFIKVWGENPEMPRFCNSDLYYYAKYYSRKEWIDMFKDLGLKQMKSSPDHNSVIDNYFSDKKSKNNLHNMFFNNVDRHYYGYYKN